MGNIHKIFILLVLLIVCYSDAKYTSGTIDTTNDFFYLGKFTYSNDG